MSNNSLGKHFVVTSFGESHGPAVGAVIDGCPPGISIDLKLLRSQLMRRRPGQSKLVTQRVETEEFQIISGTIENVTTGAPICILIPNKGHKSSDYDQLKSVYRPSHADFTYEKKYGIRDPFGGGRSSARITAGWVAAGAIAEQILHDKFNITITAYVKQVHKIAMPNLDFVPTRAQIDQSEVRCPDVRTSDLMKQLIETVREDGDSVGGIIGCHIENCPVGLGEPVFNKLQSQLAHAMMNLNAVKGFEFGSGFDSVSHRGSELNDQWTTIDEKPITETNFSGGIQGGISNGMPIYFNVAFKPTSSISKVQKTINSKHEKVDLAVEGRHDPCVVPRAVPIVEGLAAIVILDNLLNASHLKA